MSTDLQNGFDGLHLGGMKCLVTGGGGVLGSAVLAQLAQVAGVQILAPGRAELDLANSDMTSAYFEANRPDVVIHLAATVFGLAGNMGNQHRAVFENSAINHNVCFAISRVRPSRVFFAGTVASYPFPYKKIPLMEDQFFEGLPHGGEFGYAMAKRHAYSYLKVLGDEGVCKFSYGVFTNLYGEGDKFDVDGGHVIPSLIKKAFDARKRGEPLTVWGDGSAQRDFLHAADAARAVLICLKAPTNEITNISSGVGVTIRRITEVVASAAGIQDVVYDVNKPVGIPVRVVDNAKLVSLGFKPQIGIEEGLRRTFSWYENHHTGART
ncbi:NAD-dependent epimerase/dehydratase family protein [Neorhizobium sp. T786]|uniref:NAD-dependent epimerase/dehydratase family protein n=1 Tax=Pseudorhizobium xiangyangii TaxID=2883104 RepID=UPI001CFF6312|nr:NAD-dependent epimerase/dehydratase family protein [Neorhizobium xiangyangii]MCB5202609.1 NAD-dependent epimerase/dehydratase family protein [Neorhizobium xiangyangii]